MHWNGAMTNIRTRLSLVFIALGVLCVAVTSLAMHGLAEANERAEQTYQEITLPSQYFSDAYRNMLTIVLQVFEADRLNDPSASKAQFEVIDKLAPVVKADLDLFNSSRKPATAELVSAKFATD